MSPVTPAPPVPDPAASADAAALLAVLDDPVELTARLCDIPSVSGDERRIADAVEQVLRAISAGPGPELTIVRDGDALIARTERGHAERVLIAGHLDTVPIEDNLPTRRQEIDGHPVIWGRGACDMKAGVAMQLSTAHALRDPARDVTWVFYDHEEVDASLNGLGRLARNHPELLEADLAILGEPSNAGIEGGCNGTIRVAVRTTGVRAHSARAFMGVNAIHAAAPILSTLAEYEARTVTVDGLDYRESLSAVGISGGVAGNVVPDECTVLVNYRFAPSRTGAEAEAHLRELFPDHALEVVDLSEGARPGLDRPIAEEFAAAVGGPVAPKLGWTDVARFSALGTPAVNFGPGSALYAHRADEHVRTAEVVSATRALLAFLDPAAAGAADEAAAEGAA